MGWFKKKQPAAASAPAAPAGPLTAMLLLKSDRFPYESFANLLSGERIHGQKITLAQSEDHLYVFEIKGGGFGTFAEMPHPYPWSDLEGPCATSILWPEGTSADSIKDHRTFMIVTLLNDGMPPIRRRLFLTQVLAMAARDPNVMGIYWPEGTVVHHPSPFCTLAAGMDTEDDPPLLLWVDYRIFQNDDGSAGLFTTGLAPLGLMEMEIPRADMEPRELHDWGAMLTNHQLQNGPVFKDGETIGTTAEPEFRIRHRPSQFGHSETILAIEKI